MDSRRIHFGSCLCGAVRFEVEGDFQRFYLCHCGYCRKDTGSVHAANLFASGATLRWTAGKERVTCFTLPSTRHSKCFCSTCGSALPSVQMEGALLVVPAGSLDSDVTLKPDAHIFWSSKAQWDNGLGEIPMMEGSPDADIVIRDYDPAWSDSFAIIAAEVTAALGSLIIIVEHIGSTSVPGLAAKPIIDLDVVLASPADLSEAIRRLADIGYVHEGDLGITGRDALRCPPDAKPHHLYVVTADAAELRRHLAFRNSLRADHALRDAYSALKRALAHQYPHNRKSYTDAKSDFIEWVIENKI